MAGKYRKKPVTIEALYLRHGITPSEIREFYPEAVVSFSNTATLSVLISTLEGVMTARLGDWIIKGVAGEFYPCKDEIFKATYEMAETFTVDDVLEEAQTSLIGMEIVVRKLKDREDEGQVRIRLVGNEQDHYMTFLDVEQLDHIINGLQQAKSEVYGGGYSA